MAWWVVFDRESVRRPRIFDDEAEAEWFADTANWLTAMVTGGPKLERFYVRRVGFDAAKARKAVG